MLSAAERDHHLIYNVVAAPAGRLGSGRISFSLYANVYDMSPKIPNGRHVFDYVKRAQFRLYNVMLCPSTDEMYCLRV